MGVTTEKKTVPTDREKNAFEITSIVGVWDGELRKITFTLISLRSRWWCASVRIDYCDAVICVFMLLLSTLTYIFFFFLYLSFCDCRAYLSEGLPSQQKEKKKKKVYLNTFKYSCNKVWVFFRTKILNTNCNKTIVTNYFSGKPLWGQKNDCTNCYF